MGEDLMEKTKTENEEMRATIEKKTKKKPIGNDLCIIIIKNIYSNVNYVRLCCVYVFPYPIINWTFAGRKTFESIHHQPQ